MNSEQLNNNRMSSNNQNGIWDQWTADTYHQSSPKLAEYLANYLDPKRGVIDFGCGNAFYISELAKRGFKCFGVEGCPLNNFLHPNVIILDLTQETKLAIGGNVISLEVGEHLPESAEQTFLDTLAYHCTGSMIISWALPGQPGIGHVNCRPQDYIIDEIVRRGFKFLQLETEVARQNIDKNCDWFERTLLIFEKN